MISFDKTSGKYIGSLNGKVVVREEDVKYRLSKRHWDVYSMAKDGSCNGAGDN